MVTHQLARELIRNGFLAVIGREATLSEAQCAQAIGWLETQYGDGWGPHDSGFGSNNWGAIQAGSSWTGPTFEHRDSTPQPDGTSKWYTTRFRLYATPEDGAADLIRAVYQWHGRGLVLSAASAGEIYLVSEELYSTGYYQGFGATPKARIANHHKAVASAIRIFCAALNEPLPLELAPEPTLAEHPTLMMGSRGPDVQVLQRLLGLVDDGIFGPLTRAAVIQFQRDHGLTPDGWVGKQTWAALEPDTALDRKTLPEV